MKFAVMAFDSGPRGYNFEMEDQRMKSRSGRNLGIEYIFRPFFEVSYRVTRVFIMYMQAKSGADMIAQDLSITVKWERPRRFFSCFHDNRPLTPLHSGK